MIESILILIAVILLSIPTVADMKTYGDIKRHSCANTEPPEICDPHNLDPWYPWTDREKVLHPSTTEPAPEPEDNSKKEIPYP